VQDAEEEATAAGPVGRRTGQQDHRD